MKVSLAQDKPIAVGDSLLSVNMVGDMMLLARSVVIVDRERKVRYIQVVPEITHLPDMERAFGEAEELVK
jgi:peroxiredoxin